MTYPTAAVVTTDMDAGTDSPATARSALLDAVQKLNQMIAHTTAFAATLLDDANAAAARATLGAAAAGPNADITSLGAVASINGGPLAGLRNRIINGGFGVNQRAYVSGAAVGAGLYGHDRWKMAASGDTYTFSTTANVTTVTIPAGKVLQQVIEGLNLESGTYTLSWSGTAQGKIGAGSYGASGITGSITGGTNTTIEFGPGTVSKAQLEFGSVATAFEQRFYGIELALCQRYYYRVTPGLTGVPFGIGVAIGTLYAYITVPFPVTMRAVPTTIDTTNVASDYQVYVVSLAGYVNCNNIPSNATVTNFSATLSFRSGSTSFVSGNGTICAANSAGAFLAWSVEL